MFDLAYNPLLSLILSFLVSYFTVPKIILLADKYRLSVTEGKRSSHTGATPIFGGVGIFLGVLASLFFFGNIAGTNFVIFSITIVFFIGLIDDLLGLSPYKKLLGQIIATLVIIYFKELSIDSFHGVLGVRDLSQLASVSFTIFVFIVIINGVNLIDGIDGLAGGFGIISACFFGITAYIMGQMDMAILAFSLVGALFGFIRYNIHPAKIFMGDTGSLLIGMILSILAISLVDHGITIESKNFPNKGPLLAIVFLALPLFDSLRVFIVRVTNRKNPLHAGKGHIHHALLRLGLGHHKTSILLYLVSIILIILSFFMVPLDVNVSILTLSVISFSLLYIPFYLIKRKKK